MNREKRKEFAIIVGIFFLIGCILLGKDIYSINKYEKVEAVVSIFYAKRKGKADKRAKVTYEYEGREYADIVLDSYNGFTMKDGKECSIYINPEYPDTPVVPSYAFDIILIAFGGLGFFAVMYDKNKGKHYQDD